ncbi:MAG: hypothetical protein K5924_02500 [Chloroflexi bacterium]|nr:hypothetical protein [Chloroflexota bacterium]
MNEDRDFDRLMRTWLEGGSTQLSDRVLDAVLAQLPQVQQRRARPFGWLRGPDRRSVLFVVAGAAAAVVVALGIGFVTSSVGDSPQPAPPVPSAATSDIPDLPGGNLDGGTYRLWPRALVSVTLEVPGGWESYERWAINLPGASPGSMGLAFWNPANLYEDPRSSTREPRDPPVGASVEDFAQALADHPGWVAEPPRRVVIDGREGLLVRITIPPEPEIPVCESFALWKDAADGRSYCVRVPGAVVDVYIVDVRGERIVFSAQYDPEAPPDQAAALRRMVDSVRFDPAP